MRAWLAEHAPDLKLIEAHDTTATVETAAKTLGVQPGQIAKTLAVRAGEHLFLLVTRGNARLDNRKCKAHSAPARACSTRSKRSKSRVTRLVAFVLLAWRGRCRSISTSR